MASLCQPAGSFPMARIRDVASEGWPDGDALSLEEMAALPIFAGCPPELLDERVGDVSRRNYAPGELVCREGAFDATAFLLLEGEAEIFLASPVAHLEGRHRPRGLFGAITTVLQTPTRRAAASAGARRRIPIDAPIDLSQDNPTATLGAGDLFGEMTCLSSHPRSATVRAQTAVVALEMRRGILQLLRHRSPGFQAQAERDYKARALRSHLRGVPLFSGLSDAFVAGLRERVELVRYEPGQVVHLLPNGHLIRACMLRVQGGRQAFLEQGGRPCYQVITLQAGLITFKAYFLV